jgi:hypothetical protein
VIIDTGVIVAFHNTKDEKHERAKELIRKAAGGEYGLPYTTDYIFDEAVTLALIRTGRKDIANSVGRMILGESIPKFLLLLRTGERIFKDAWKIFKKMDKMLSFTDCTIIAVAKVYNINSVMSFDSDFDGLVERVY